MIRFDPTTAATSTPVSADAFVPDHSATVLADEAAWRVPPPGNSLGSSVVATRWRGAARLASEIHHETPQEAHLVMVVMNTANIRLSVNGATVMTASIPGIFHVSEPGARVSCLFRGAHEFLHLHVPNALIEEYDRAVPNAPAPQFQKPACARTRWWSASRRPARGRADRRHARRPLRRLHQRGHRDAAVDLGGARRTTGATRVSELARWRLRRAIEFVETNLANSISTSNIGGCRADAVLSPPSSRPQRACARTNICCAGGSSAPRKCLFRPACRWSTSRSRSASRASRISPWFSTASSDARPMPGASRMAKAGTSCHRPA